jgi:PadR family transcriptional regulator PadR
MSRNELQGTLDLLILKSLAQLPPAYGYDILLHIRNVSGQRLRIEQGSLYPALHRMEEDGWVRSFWTRSDRERMARYYKLTRKGRNRLKLYESKWEEVAQGVQAILGYSRQSVGSA